MFFRKKNKYFKYAQENIICNCSRCLCPSATGGKGKYSFVYIREELDMIYFNVPKAASSSIRQYFFHYNNRYSMLHPKKNESDYFKFSFVRNPWDRLVSNWKMFTQLDMRKLQLEAMVGSSDFTLEEFITITGSYKNHHWAPQSDFVPENIDFIGKVESFEEDMEYIHDKLNISFDTSKWKTRLNQTSRKKDYKYYFDERNDLINRVQEIYSKDVERFNYKY